MSSKYLSYLLLSSHEANLAVKERLVSVDLDVFYDPTTSNQLLEIKTDNFNNILPLQLIK